MGSSKVGPHYFFSIFACFPKTYSILLAAALQLAHVNITVDCSNCASNTIYYKTKFNRFNHRQCCSLFASAVSGFPVKATDYCQSFTYFFFRVLLSLAFIHGVVFVVVIFGFGLVLLSCVTGPSLGTRVRSSSPLDRLGAYAEERIQIAVQRVDPLGVRLEIEPVHLDHVPFVLHARVAEGDLWENGDIA